MHEFKLNDYTVYWLNVSFVPSLGASDVVAVTATNCGVVVSSIWAVAVEVIPAEVPKQQLCCQSSLSNWLQIAEAK